MSAISVILDISRYHDSLKTSHQDFSQRVKQLAKVLEKRYDELLKNYVV